MALGRFFVTFTLVLSSLLTLNADTSNVSVTVVGSAEEAPTPQCGDSIDNDGDGKIDYPADLGCDSATDDSESGEINAAPNGPPGGGGGSGFIGTQVIFEGAAFSGAIVSVLADGLSAGKGRANASGEFSVLLDDLVPGVYIFNIYVTDELGRHTRPNSYALKIQGGTITRISGILLLRPAAYERPFSCEARADVNDDCRVDIVDFSIVAYWWQRPLSGPFVVTEQERLNGDGKITLEDFSILAYYWTG